MKKLYTLVAAIGIASASFAQQFSDDFESYTTGQYLGEQSQDWTTWSGNVGAGAGDDIVVSEGADANSGTKYLHFEGTGANGGPADVVLPFGGEHSSGTFNYTMSLKVISGAYFNFQSDEVVGRDWAIDVHMDGTGGLEVGDDGAGVVYFTSDFPLNEWFEMELDINLTNNNWRIFINGEEKGSWSNNSNQIALLDLYPTAGDEFFVDDVSYTYEQFVLPQTNGAVFNIAPLSGLEGQEKLVTAEFRNLGVNEITSFELLASTATSSATYTASGMSLNSYDIVSVEFDDPITLKGGEELTVEVVKVNGVAGDDDASDDSKTISVTAIVPTEGKMVVGEEGTGTWCGWCPRGMVAMEEMAMKYPDHFVGIAVHNNDPMANSVYDTWMGTQISGYPGGLVNRTINDDPSTFESSFLNEIVRDVDALIDVDDFYYNPATGKLYAEVVVNMLENGSSTWKVAVALIENGLTGTTGQWSQANYYSYQSNNLPLVGPHRDWQAAPNPVPASELVYNEVARGIFPSAEGGDLAERPRAGDEHRMLVELTVDPSWDMNKMYIVPMVINHRRQIVNANKIPVSQARTSTTGVNENSATDFTFHVAPNPADDQTMVHLNLETSNEVSISIFNAVGQEVYQQNFGEQSGDLYYPVNTSQLNAGMYVIQLNVNGNTRTQRLSIK